MPANTAGTLLILCRPGIGKGRVVVPIMIAVKSATNFKREYLIVVKICPLILRIVVMY